MDPKENPTKENLKLSNLEEKLTEKEKLTQPKTSESFWDSYFQSKDFEKSGKLYEALGVKLFSKYWLNGGSYWTQRGQSPMVRGRKKKDLGDYIVTTKALERPHLIFLPVYFTVTAMCLAYETYNMAAFSVMANIAINFYPIMSLRYNRNRAVNLIERLERK